MAQYIDKDALVAEIERLIERAKAERVLHPKTILAAKNYLLIEDYNKLLSFLDTIEVKEVQEEPVSEDLENEIQRYYVDWDEHPQYVQTARHFAKWQKEQMMKGAIDVKINRDTLYDLKPFIHEKYLDYKIGDKCKMILIKED